MSVNFTIDESLCINCGLCMQECGHHEGKQQLKRVVPDNPDCSRCYHCYTICPSGAIHTCDGSSAPLFNRAKLQEITSENLLNFLGYRRSIRSFKQKQIDNSLIEELLSFARYIPSGGNAHSYEFTVLKGDSEVTKSLKKELEHIYEKRSMLLNNIFLRNLAKPFVNGLARGFLRDREYRIRISKLVEQLHNKEDVFFRNAPDIVILHSKAIIPTPKEDCILAGYNITMLAQAKGLGSCFVTLAQNAINSSSRCKKVLNLSKNEQVYAVVILGYPAVNHLRIAPKKEKTIQWL